MSPRSAAAGGDGSLTRRAVTVTGVVIAGLLLVLALWQALEVLLVVFAGVLVAVMLRFMSGAISRRTPLGEGWALTLVLLVLLGGSTLAVWTLGPGVAEEVQALASGMSESVEDLEAILLAYPLGAYALEHLPAIDTGDASRMWSRIGGISATVFGAVAAFFITVFVGVFLAYNPRMYLQGLLRLVPLARRERASEVLEQLGVTLRWWLVGQLISMVLLWLSTWLVLHLLGVPLAFILGLLTGLLTFIPYLGPLIAVVPIALVAFLDSPMLGLMAVSAYFVIQNIEANVIMPLVFEKTVSIPPALSVASQLLMASLLGILGVLLATPLLAVAMVLARMLYVEDVLGDDMDEPLEHCPEVDG
ncbi:MAG: AI-2E family transporter [Pseudomonadota bacterium]|nr:AI-2E family transporter [Pseudomonadota bacterium]